MHISDTHPPMNTSSIEQIQDEKAGYVLTRESKTRDFTFIRKNDPEKKRRKYSWDETISDGTPVTLYHGVRTKYVWIDNDEIAFNPQLLKEIQGNIQNALDDIFNWNCRSIIDIKNSIETFLKIADGRIFTTYKDSPFDFLSPWLFVFDLVLPSMDKYNIGHLKPIVGESLAKKYGDHSYEYNYCVDLDGNVLVLLKNGTMLTPEYSLPRMNHMTNIEVILYKIAEKTLTDYYNNESPAHIEIKADKLIYNSKSNIVTGINIPSPLIAECFGRDTVKNSETIFDFTTSSFDQIPLNKWPNKPERKKNMSEKEMTTYRHNMYVWIAENCNHNRQEETKILYEKFLELHHDSLPEHINYPLYPEDDIEETKESKSINDPADLLTEKPAMTTLSMFA